MSDTITKKIALDEIEAKVRELANERPEFAYEPWTGEKAEGVFVRCLYVHEGGKPGCIFGHALKALGFPIESYFTEEVEGTGIVGLLSREDFLEYVKVEAAAAEVAKMKWFGRVQSLQDKGFKWGEVVYLADNPLV